MQAWLLRSSISRVPIVNLSPVLGRLHNYLGIALNSAGESVLLPEARLASWHYRLQNAGLTEGRKGML